jgi:DNA-binding NarL/FixJ family response regulator
MDKIRILLMDDSVPFLNMATNFLSDHENLIVVGAAHNGEEAVLMAANLLPDIILLDVKMPGMSGIEIAPRLREILPGAGNLMLSFQNSFLYKEAAMVAGADDFIPKETLAFALIPAILRVSQKSERFVSAE